MPVAKPKRRWIEYTTQAALVLLVGAGLVVTNVLGRHEDNSSPRNCELPSLRHGWPVTFLVRADIIFKHTLGMDIDMPAASRWPLVDDATVWYWSPVALAIDAALGLGMLFCTAFVVRRRLRRRPGPVQFRLRTALIATGLVAVLLGLGQMDVLRWEILVRIPVGIGLVCTALTVVSAVRGGISLRGRGRPSSADTGSRRFGRPRACPTAAGRDNGS